jgi:FixJ family two-component response regulator
MRRLTPREREVMLLVAEGWTSKEIAKVLGLSHRTVELHRAMILGKMQASSLAALIRMVLATEHDEGTRPGAI